MKQEIFYDIVHKLYIEKDLSDEELLCLIQTGEYDERLFDYLEEKEC